MIQIAEYTDYTEQPENSTGGKFLNLKAKGDKVNIRIAAKPITYFQHWVEGKPINCPDKATCTTCNELEALSPADAAKKENQDKKRKQVYVWPVIDRADGKAKIFKGGVQIFLGLRKYALSDKWGDPTTWDVVIEREELNPANYYSVVPDPDSRTVKITKEEQVEIDKLGSLVDSTVMGKEVLDEADTENLPF